MKKDKPHVCFKVDLYLVLYLKTYTLQDLTCTPYSYYYLSN